MLVSLNATYQQHLRRKHRGQYKFCDECGKSFSTTFTLDRHLKNVHSLRKFSCNICQEGFETRNLVNFHRRSHSSKEIAHCTTCEKIKNVEEQLQNLSKEQLKLENYKKDLKKHACL